MLEMSSSNTFVSQLSYSNWSRDLRELALKNLIELKNKAMIFYFFCINLVLRNPRFRSFASLMLFMALTLRLFASLLALTLALAYLSLAQHPYAFDHAFPCPLWSFSLHALFVSFRYFYNLLSSPFLVLLSWSIDELWLRCSF